MRALFFLLLSFTLLGLFIWATLSGALFVVGVVFLILGMVLAIGYADTAVLFFLGARFVRSADEPGFHSAASQEAYKLAVPLPDLYFYNGSLERGFVLQNRKTVSLVLSRALLDHVHPGELSAVCFELLLQVKKNMAAKRTKGMFIIGLLSWAFHGIAGLIGHLIPVKEVNRALGWIMTFFLHPCLEVIFQLTLGGRYFKRLKLHMADYPAEEEDLRRVGLKLRKPAEVYSLPSKKLLEFSSVAKSRHFQNILALELLPHEWDFFFKSQDAISAEET